MRTTKQASIKKYVILKINSGEWKPKSKIPSENTLARKFGFSRLTVRTALQTLVENGILLVNKGGGYYVSDHISSMMHHSTPQSTKTTVKIIKPAKELIELFNVKRNENTMFLVKEYFNNDKLVMKQYSVFNKDLIWRLDMKELEISLTHFLAYQGIAINFADIILEPYLTINDKFKKDAIELGIEDKNLVEYVFSYSDEGWVERTIRLKKPELMIFKYRQRNFL